MKYWIDELAESPMDEWPDDILSAYNSTLWCLQHLDPIEVWKRPTKKRSGYNDADFVAASLLFIRGIIFLRHRRNYAEIQLELRVKGVA